jgi:hypothetical protein
LIVNMEPNTIKIILFATSKFIEALKTFIWGIYQLIKIFIISYPKLIAWF